MNGLDVILLIIVGVSVGAGMMKGLVREVLSLVGVLLGILLALILSPGIAPHLYRWIPYEGAAYAAAFVLVFTGTMIATGLVGVLVTKVLDFAQLGFANRLLGGVFGLIRGALIGLVLVLGLTLFMEPASPFLGESRIVPHLAWGARGLAPLLPEGPRQLLLDRLDRFPSEDRPIII